MGMPYPDLLKKRLIAPTTGSAVNSPFWGGSQYSTTDQDVGIKIEPFQLNVGQLQLGNSVWA